MHFKAGLAYPRMLEAIGESKHTRVSCSIIKAIELQEWLDIPRSSTCSSTLTQLLKYPDISNGFIDERSDVVFGEMMARSHFMIHESIQNKVDLIGDEKSVSDH